MCYFQFTLIYGIIEVGVKQPHFMRKRSMDEKEQLLKKFIPLALLKPMTPVAERAIAQTVTISGLIPIRHFPFRVGRESRVKIIDGRIERIERVKFNDVAPNNDLYLIDDGHLLNISREHFQIERDGDKYYLFDRGSACGTRIGEESVGGSDVSGSLPLADGDIITIGTKKSPYLYQFILLDQFEITLRDSSGT